MVTHFGGHFFHLERWVSVSLAEAGQACDCSGSDAVWLPRPGHSRPCPSMHCWLRRSPWSPELPHKRSNCQAGAAMCHLSDHHRQPSSPPCQVKNHLGGGSFSPNCSTSAIWAPHRHSRHPSLSPPDIVEQRRVGAFSKFLTYSTTFRLLGSGMVGHAVISKWNKESEAFLENLNDPE